MNKSFIEIDPTVREALNTGVPVVALESTIISHGMPYPKNVETALAVEEMVRSNGAVPATIAIFEGKCRIGLNAEQLEYFGKAAGVWKVSLRDIPYVLSKHLYGATTVAATMRIASFAGIKVLATGGIGGVHRGAATNMDISADLTEMAQTSVAVISAGIKSILDIGLTLEYLETQGIPVVTVGQDEFPSFYSTKSKYPSPLRLDTFEEIASMLHTKWSLDLRGSVLIANPVPAALGQDYHTIEAHIQDALAAAAVSDVKGKDITPFLLKYIAENSAGESLETNIALVLNNARLGAAIAVALQKLE
ncbi:MAG: pseudouridine-5'-phosphate glycosidase [Ferruginibacter sp.]|nr:pseudouridine-5'-phosphate glycosidase [Ferruginibacter sp.]